MGHAPPRGVPRPTGPPPKPSDARCYYDADGHPKYAVCVGDPLMAEERRTELIRHFSENAGPPILMTDGMRVEPLMATTYMNEFCETEVALNYNGFAMKLSLPSENNELSMRVFNARCFDFAKSANIPPGDVERAIQHAIYGRSYVKNFDPYVTPLQSARRERDRLLAEREVDWDAFEAAVAKVVALEPDPWAVERPLGNKSEYVPASNWYQSAPAMFGLLMVALTIVFGLPGV